MRRDMMALSILILTLGLLTTSAAAAPEAAFSDTTFDFGFVPQNAKISHVFTINSVGEDTLKIVKVIPGCGCTKVPLEKSEIAPGEQGKIEVVFSTGQYRGRVTKHPRVLTNENRSQHKLQFLSTVEMHPDSSYPLIIRPSILDLSGEIGAAGKSMSVRITNVTDSPISMKLIDRPEGLLKITLPETIAAESSAEATVELVGPADPAGLQKSFTLQLDDAQRSRYTVPVKVDATSSTGHAEANQGH